MEGRDVIKREVGIETEEAQIHFFILMEEKSQNLKFIIYSYIYLK